MGLLSRLYENHPATAPATAKSTHETKRERFMRIGTSTRERRLAASLCSFARRRSTAPRKKVAPLGTAAVRGAVCGLPRVGGVANHNGPPSPCHSTRAEPRTTRLPAALLPVKGDCLHKRAKPGGLIPLNRSLEL